eukprot:GHVO01028814.1.p1 GENE.GHVO01028814.1~~GHVO01028814.1.p1  ORF type:complete len:1889 (-),score=349.74 GHVO01028814.1:3395-8533(-)
MTPKLTPQMTPKLTPQLTTNLTPKLTPKISPVPYSLSPQHDVPNIRSINIVSQLEQLDTRLRWELLLCPNSSFSPRHTILINDLKSLSPLLIGRQLIYRLAVRQGYDSVQVLFRTLLNPSNQSSLGQHNFQSIIYEWIFESFGTAHFKNMDLVKIGACYNAHVEPFLPISYRGIVHTLPRAIILSMIKGMTSTYADLFQILISLKFHHSKISNDMSQCPKTIPESTAPSKNMLFSVLDDIMTNARCRCPDAADTHPPKHGKQVLGLPLAMSYIFMCRNEIRFAILTLEWDMLKTVLDTSLECPSVDVGEKYPIPIVFGMILQMLLRWIIEINKQSDENWDMPASLERLDKMINNSNRSTNIDSLILSSDNLDDLALDMSQLEQNHPLVVSVCSSDTSAIHWKIWNEFKASYGAPNIDLREFVMFVATFLGIVIRWLAEISPRNEKAHMFQKTKEILRWRPYVQKALCGFLLFSATQLGHLGVAIKSMFQEAGHSVMSTRLLGYQLLAAHALRSVSDDDDDDRAGVEIVYFRHSCLRLRCGIDRLEMRILQGHSNTEYTPMAVTLLREFLFKETEALRNEITDGLYNFMTLLNISSWLSIHGHQNSIIPRADSECPRLESECPRLESECPRLESECPRLESECPRLESECPENEGLCKCALWFMRLHEHVFHSVNIADIRITCNIFWDTRQMHSLGNALLLEPENLFRHSNVPRYQSDNLLGIPDHLSYHVLTRLAAHDDPVAMIDVDQMKISDDCKYSRGYPALDSVSCFMGSAVPSGLVAILQFTGYVVKDNNILDINIGKNYRRQKYNLLPIVCRLLWKEIRDDTFMTLELDCIDTLLFRTLLFQRLSHDIRTGFHSDILRHTDVDESRRCGSVGLFAERILKLLAFRLQSLFLEPANLHFIISYLVQSREFVEKMIRLKFTDKFEVLGHLVSAAAASNETGSAPSSSLAVPVIQRLRPDCACYMITTLIETASCIIQHVNTTCQGGGGVNISCHMQHILLACLPSNSPPHSHLFCPLVNIYDIDKNDDTCGDDDASDGRGAKNHQKTRSRLVSPARKGVSDMSDHSNGFRTFTPKKRAPENWDTRNFGTPVKRGMSSSSPRENTCPNDRINTPTGKKHGVPNSPGLGGKHSVPNSPGFSPLSASVPFLRQARISPDSRNRSSPIARQNVSPRQNVSQSQKETMDWESDDEDDDLVTQEPRLGPLAASSTPPDSLVLSMSLPPNILADELGTHSVTETRMCPKRNSWTRAAASYGWITRILLQHTIKLLPLNSLAETIAKVFARIGLWSQQNRTFTRVLSADVFEYIYEIFTLSSSCPTSFTAFMQDSGIEILSSCSLGFVALRDIDAIQYDDKTELYKSMRSVSSMPMSQIVNRASFLTLAIGHSNKALYTLMKSVSGIATGALKYQKTAAEGKCANAIPKIVRVFVEGAKSYLQQEILELRRDEIELECCLGNKAVCELIKESRTQSPNANTQHHKLVVTCWNAHYANEESLRCQKRTLKLARSMDRFLRQIPEPSADSSYSPAPDSGSSRKRREAVTISPDCPSTKRGKFSGVSRQFNARSDNDNPVQTTAAAARQVAPVLMSAEVSAPSAREGSRIDRAWLETAARVGQRFDTARKTQQRIEIDQMRNSSRADTETEFTCEEASESDDDDDDLNWIAFDDEEGLLATGLDEEVESDVGGSLKTSSALEKARLSSHWAAYVSGMFCS